MSLRARILAVNLFAVLVLAGGLVYLDSYRGRLIDQRRAELADQARLIAAAFPEREPERWSGLAAWYGAITGARLRVFDSAGHLAADSWRESGPSFRLRDPETEPTRRRVGAALDRAIGWVMAQPRPAPFPAVWPASRDAWPEIAATRRSPDVTAVRLGPDDTFLISAAQTIRDVAPAALNEAAIVRPVLHLTADARDITYRVRDERLRAFRLFLLVLALTAALSMFLAGTIARPLERLAAAAQRVKAGRAREVVVPRLPERRDEIGELARAVSDMSQALRQRIDATEAFAADVAHELKNPLASLRSALETLPKVDDAARAELLALMADDVARLDRLIGGVAEASRVDAEMSRATFAPVDLHAIAAGIARHLRPPRGVKVAVAGGPAAALGDAVRLGQVVANLVDNALSFSPDGGTVTLTTGRDDGRACLHVEDEGPGVPPDARDHIFDRFYSARPEGEAFGRHSGLGLAIAKAIVEAHGGTIRVADRPGGGARFTVALPGA